jgi:hypothetical protein
MDVAEKVADDATSVTQADVDRPIAQTGSDGGSSEPSSLASGR